MFPDFPRQFIKLSICDGLRFAVGDKNAGQRDNAGDKSRYHPIHIVSPRLIDVKTEHPVKIVRYFIVNIEQYNGSFGLNHLLCGGNADVTGF